MRVCLTLLISFALLTILEREAPAQQPAKVFAFQGILTGPNGVPTPDGPVNVTFRLYTASTGGSPVWTETKSITVSKSLFSTALGDVAPFPSGVDFGSTSYWLSLQVANDPEATPRRPVQGVPYAFSFTTPLAGDVTGLQGATSVSRLAGIPLAAAAPTAGQVLKFDGISGRWQPGPDNNSGGTVTGVNATAPLTSSGGSTPAISLTGIVPVANGGTGLSTGPTAAHQFLRGVGAGAWTVGAVTIDDLPGLSSLYVDRTSDQGISGKKSFQSSVGIGGPAPTLGLEVAGPVRISGAGNGLTFADGTSQSTAAAGVPSGFFILGDSPVAPVGYTFSGIEVVSGNTWTSRRQMTSPRLGFGAAEVGNKVYVIGGNDGGGGFLNTVEVYDPASDTWALRAPMPTPRRHLAVVSVNNLIFAIGGEAAGGLSSVVEVYNTQTNVWSTGAPMPTERAFAAAAAIGSTVYVFGGEDPDGRSAVVEAYNTTGNSWSTLASMPTARQSPVASRVGGLIYLIGGQANTGVTAVNEEYNPSSNSWAARARMPQPRTLFTAVEVNQKVYAFGGEGDARSLTTTEEYDPAADDWTSRAPMMTDLSELSAVVVGDHVFVLGGIGAAVSDLNQRYTPPIILYGHRKD